MTVLPSRALLYARTLRHLRAIQCLYLPIRRLQGGRPPRVRQGAWGLDEERLPALAECAAWLVGLEAPDAVRVADEVAAGTFRFLNHAESLGASVDWTRRHVSHLWSYNLHYFDYARALVAAHRLTGRARYAERFRELAEGWMRACPPGRGDGWEPYALSVRAVNWSYALLGFGDALEPGFRTRLAGSIHLQLSVLERRLEWHLLANHLQKNLFALAVGGLLFTGPRADRWRGQRTRMLWRQLGEQVHADGTHVERSSMYHAIALGDFLEFASLGAAAGRRLPTQAEGRLRAMVRALGVLSRPSGVLHRFNDTADGTAPPRARLSAIAARVLGEQVPAPAGVLSLQSGGFLGWTSPNSSVRLVADVGNPGPAYQPGHAHNGLLGFELDLAGVPFAVDPGVHGYDGDPFREYARSTRAHNTVAIAGGEQSETWGTFRMGGRARVVSARAAGDGGSFRLSAACRHHHAARAVHRRTIMLEDGAWVVTDQVEGAPGAALASFLHLHPDWELVETGGGAFVARREGGPAVRIETFGMESAAVVRGAAEPVQGWYFPEFGRALPCATLVMSAAPGGGGFGYRIVLES